MSPMETIPTVVARMSIKSAQVVSGVVSPNLPNVSGIICVRGINLSAGDASGERRDLFKLRYVYLRLTQVLGRACPGLMPLASRV